MVRARCTESDGSDVSDSASEMLASQLFSGRHFTRRQVLQYSGGLAALVAFGPFARSVVAQGSGGPAQLFNPSENPPTTASGELKHALVFDPTNLDSAATYTVSNAEWEGAVYSPLTWRDPNLVLYDGLDSRPTPDKGFGLAASWEYTDDKTLKMSLKTGITFHDGYLLGKSREGL